MKTVFRHSFSRHRSLKILSWNFAYEFILLYYRSKVRVSSICVNFCRSCDPFGTKNTGNTVFNTSPTCFDILSWNFVYDFHLMKFRLRSSVINFRQFRSEIRPLLELRILEIQSFRTFLLHALTYWAEIPFYEFQIKWLNNLGSSLKEFRSLWMFNFAHFSCAWFEIELKFLVWLCFLTLYSFSKVL